MAHARVVLPLKLLLGAYLAALQIFCVCSAHAVAPERPTATHAEHDCCHDDGSEHHSGEAQSHEHRGDCPHCEGTSLRPAAEVSAPAAPFVYANLVAPLAQLVFGTPSTTRAPASDHPPHAASPPGLPVLHRTSILIV